jgi:Tol biopolymer transport system component
MGSQQINTWFHTPFVYPAPAFAAWSPNGKQLTYSGEIGGDLFTMTWDLFVHDLERNRAERLTQEQHAGTVSLR